MSGGFVLIAILPTWVLVWAGLNWRKNVPPEKIDRKVFRFIRKDFKENRTVSTSSVYMEFIGERVRLLDQSLDRLTKLGFINATVEHRGNPVTVTRIMHRFGVAIADGVVAVAAVVSTQ